jgi:precorrin isomerase
MTMELVNVSKSKPSWILMGPVGFITVREVNEFVNGQIEGWR